MATSWDRTGYTDGQWDLFSGKLELGENAVSAVIRKTGEEIGVELAAIRAAGGKAQVCTVRIAPAT